MNRVQRAGAERKRSALFRRMLLLSMLLSWSAHAEGPPSQLLDEAWTPETAAVRAAQVLDFYKLRKNQTKELYIFLSSGQDRWTLLARCWNTPPGAPDFQARRDELDRLVQSLDKVCSNLAWKPTLVTPESTAKAQAQLTSEVVANAQAQLREQGKAVDALIQQLGPLEAFLLHPQEVNEGLLQEILASPDRLDACLQLQQAYKADGWKRSSLPAVVHQGLDRAAREQVRNSNPENKGLGIPGNLTHDTGLVERPGAPDRAAVGLTLPISSRGETEGVQLQGTVNLGAILAILSTLEDPSAKQVYSLLRRSFLQFSLPLSPGMISEVPDSIPFSTSHSESGGTFSLMFGLGLLNNTDPRGLESEDPDSTRSDSACYRTVQALDPVPAVSDPRTEEEVRSRREELYGVCAQRTQEQARVSLQFAWRWFASVEPNREDAWKHDPVLLRDFSMALPWSRRPSFLFSPYYRATFWPHRTNEFGLGFSTGVTDPGRLSRDGSWFRLSLDAMFFVRDREDNHAVADPSIRLLPAIHLRVLPRTSLALALGIEARLAAPEKRSLIGSFALTFDADK